MEDPRKQDGSEADAYGLPLPRPYDEPLFTVDDYFSAEFAEALSIGEAIDIRGFKAMLRDLSPRDLEDPVPGFDRVGTVDLWADFLWEAYESRNVEGERVAASVKEGDWLRIQPNDDEWNGPIYWLSTLDGDPIPFDIAYDYGRRFLEGEFEKMGCGEELVLRIKEVDCFGGTCAPDDPEANWRVYTCKADVFKVAKPA